MFVSTERSQSVYALEADSSIDSGGCYNQIVNFFFHNDLSSSLLCKVANISIPMFCTLFNIFLSKNICFYTVKYHKKSVLPEFILYGKILKRLIGSFEEE